MQCIFCKHMSDIENSEGEFIYICTNTESGAYLEITGICGNCDWEPEREEEVAE
jgi:hypothetical protein